MEMQRMTTFKLSEEDILKALKHHIERKAGVILDQKSLQLKVKEITEEYSIGNFETDTRHVGYEITAEAATV